MRRPTWLETVLLMALAVALTALLVRGDGGLAARSAYAAGGGGANGVVAFTVTGWGQNQSELLCLIDTAKQRLCLYKWDGNHIGLVAARAYDYDLEILDSTGDKVIGSGSGASRGYIKSQVEQARRAQAIQPQPRPGG